METYDRAGVDRDRWIANQLRVGVDPTRVCIELVKQGHPHDLASDLVTATVESMQATGEVPDERQIRSARGLKLMLQGFLWCAGGIVATMISAAVAESASSNGYVVFTGAIFIGFLEFVYGFFKWVVNKV